MTRTIVDPDAIPGPLKSRDQFLHWDSSNDTPRRPHREGDFTVSWSDPEEWLSFADAMRAAANRDSWGIGYVTAVHNDDAPMGMISVIDLDDAADENDEIADWVPSLEPFLERDIYIEWSPSHHEDGPSGLHIPVVGSDVPQWWSDSHIEGGHAGADLLCNKFCTFTGDRYDGAGDDLATYGEWLRDWLAELYTNLNGEPPARNPEPAPRPARDDSRDYDDDWLDEETVEEALDHIDPGASYETWRNVGFALADHFSAHTAKTLFDNWSRRSSKYDDKAKSLIEDIADRGSGGITIATLVHHATEGGWSPSRPTPNLDVVKDAGEAEDDAPEPETPPEQTDGGIAVETATTAQTPSVSLADAVGDILIAADNEDILQKTARHRIAMEFDRRYWFAYPEEEVRGWRSTLYVYNDDEGVYEPRGENFVRRKLERVAGDWVTNTVTNEIVGKLERMSIARGDRFDTSPNRLVVANGILDLHDGHLDEWSPHELHRTKLDVAWNPDAGEPDAVDEFLHDIVEPGDVGTLYRLIAHTLYKEYVGEKAAMLVGGGQNGKSVFLDLVEQFLGDYNVSHRALQDFDDNQFAANQLEGKMANIHPDMGDESVTDMSTFKKLTGRDTMTADVKYEAPITFENFATLMFAANEMPVFGEDNHAIWRRWVYVSFPHTFDATDPEAKDPEPKRVLMDRLTRERELEALLVRCQREIEAWHDGREWYPDAMAAEAVREQMKKAAEPVFDFAMTCLRDVDDEGAHIEKEEVREAYREYATVEGLPKMGKDQFGERMLNLSDFNITSARIRSGSERKRVYAGVEWTERGRQVLGLDDPDDEQSQVGDTAQHSAIVLEHVRDLVAENGNEPVEEAMVIGKAMNDMAMTTAQNAVADLKQNGRVLDTDDGLIDT